MSPLLVEILRRLNLVLASTTVLFAFSLLAYLFVYNVRNAVARAFVRVLALVTIVYVGDVFLAAARLDAANPATRFWLHFEWIGVALVAPAFYHMGSALLATTGRAPARNGFYVLLAWAMGLVALADALFTQQIVGAPFGPAGAVRLAPGPLFGVFALGFALWTAGGTWHVWRARVRALTPRSRRRNASLLVAVVAPLSVFPYLAVGGASIAASPAIWHAVNIAANAALATMLVLVTYGVAFNGTLMPERAVRRDFVKYLVHGPALGAFALLMLQSVPRRLELSLGLPRDAVLSLAVVLGIVGYQFMVRAAKPYVDRIIFGGEGPDVMWLRRLDERLLTAHDLEQLFENIIAILCDRLRVTTGCIIGLGEGRPAVDAWTGERARTLALLAGIDLTELARQADADGYAGTHQDFRIYALRARGGGAFLGLLAVEDPARTLLPDEAATVASLVAAAQEALEERVIQQRVLASLRALEPELEGVQRLRGALEPVAGGTALLPDAAAPDDATTPASDAAFTGWVRDALAHYWGGPKLSESPLLGLGVVRRALAEHDGNPGRAIRSVLEQALEQLKPDDGERSPTASQWLLYNILELKFVRGHTVREIAERLALSESDLYRKQRVAIEALAQQLAVMEAGASTGLRTSGRTSTIPAE
ncbi:MAG: hypothetical protein IT332_13400 [Ardenticatenales bacterium]|nr:hypothetical protein [Ardenticatenales bacterium]